MLSNEERKMRKELQELYSKLNLSLAEELRLVMNLKPIMSLGNAIKYIWTRRIKKGILP